MAAPTTEFNNLDITLAGTALDSNAERLAIDDVVSTGAGNELDFGSVNIGGGAVDSGVLAAAWQVSAFGGNAQVENFRFWLSDNGFDIGASVVKWFGGKMDATTEWVQNATTGSYSYATLVEAEPAQNVYQGGDGSTTSIPSGDNDTSEFLAMYVAIGASETTGVYKGTDAGFEFQYSFKYDYY